MLKGKEFGTAIGKAIQLKLDSGAVKSKADIARHFDIKPPSLVDWVKKGSVSKDKLPELWRFFSDVAGPDHWGMTDSEWPTGIFAKSIGCSMSDLTPLLGKESKGSQEQHREATTAQDIAKALRITVHAISERWGISIADLIDGSDAAMSRVEASISARLPLQEASAVPAKEPRSKKPRSKPTSVHDYNPPGAGYANREEPADQPTSLDGSAED